MADLNIGDPAYASFGKYGRINVRRGTVTKITPSGQIVIDFGEKNVITGKSQSRRFKGSRELGGSWDSCGHLISREEYEEQSAAQAVMDHLVRALEVCRTARFRKAQDLDLVIDKLTRLKASLPIAPAEAEIARLSHPLPEQGGGDA